MTEAGMKGIEGILAVVIVVATASILKLIDRKRDAEKKSDGSDGLAE